MSPNKVPTIAAWMLQHLVPGDHNEVLEGDLLEELGSGRSSSWYRRQVLGTIAIAWRREIADHRIALLFATLWSMLTPAWMVLVHTRAFRDLVTSAQRFDWPWSAICPVPLWFSLLLAFLWTGLLLFFCWSKSMTKHFNPRSFRQGFARGTLILMPVWLASFVLNAFCPSNLWLTAFSRCLPFFVATLCATWTLSRDAHSAGVDREVAQDGC